MDMGLCERLAALPRVSRANMERRRCKACGGNAEFFDVVDFNKCCAETEVYAFGASGIPVQYFRCVACGFIFTPFFDGWTPAEFARFIYNDDYILVDGEYAGIRPAREAASMAQRLSGVGALRILDYGSGSGAFADALRALGREGVESYDPFSNPTRPNGRFDLVTCFEVLEHTTSPQATLADIASLLDPAGCVIFGTGIQPRNIGEVRANWWYVAPRNGHASIYTLNALALAGQGTGLTLHAGSGGTAFAGSTPSVISCRLLDSIGLPFQIFELTAPDKGEPLTSEQRMSWYSVEGIGAEAYRWTREPNIVWRLRSDLLQPGQLTFRIPVQNEIQPGFAEACRLEIGKTSIPLTREFGVLDGVTNPAIAY